MDLSFLSSELLNITFLDMEKFQQNFSAYSFSSGHFLLNRRTFPDERIFRQKSKCRFSPDNFFLTYLNRWIRQGIKFPDKSLHCFPSSGRFFFLFWTLEQQISQKIKILTKVWTSFFFQLFTSEPIYIFRLRGIKFADKTWHCFPSSDRFYPLQSIKISDKHDISLILDS